MSYEATTRTELDAASDDIRQRFLDGESVLTLVRARSDLVDSVLTHLWRQNAPDCVGVAALIAVGGYGRAELHPASDVDIMVLVPKKLSTACKSQIGNFVTSLWDVGLEIGHSVRTVKQCRNEAKADLTVATTMMESFPNPTPRCACATTQPC